MDLHDKKAWLTKHGNFIVNHVDHDGNHRVIVDYITAERGRRWTKTGYSFDHIVGLMYDNVKQCLYDLCDQ